MRIASDLKYRNVGFFVFKSPFLLIVFRILSERFLTLKSFVKLTGPPIVKAIKELEKISIGMPEVCIMDTIIASSGADYAESAREFSTQEYFSPLGEISLERCTQ